ncbi:MAG TPA: arginine deiminase family protein [Kofleriaceae bacterium]|nr:arginine deiminase family protein [Kofleriaceae bacterium]
MTIAITREVSDRFASAISAAVPESPIDVARARSQHLAYRAALESLGARVIVVDADDACPDCVFVEDTAVFAAGLAVVTRPGAVSRRAEVEPIARALSSLGISIARMHAPATLDGGDCLRVGRTIYVGRSARTNAAGIAALAGAFESRGVRVVAVTMPPRILHLKCVCSPLGDDRILLARGSIDPSTFAGVSIVWAPADETYAANAVFVGGGVIVAEGFPRTREALEGAGLRTIAVPCGEVRKADGSLTCQSIILPA